MTEQTYPHGALPDPRPEVEKAKDHKHVAGSVALNWQELDLTKLNLGVSQRLQDGSYSCVFQAGATALEKLTGEIISASEYFWRKNYPDQGSYLQNMADIFKNKMVVTEAISPSQNQSEPQMNQLKALSTFLGITGYKQPNPKSIDEVAEAIESYKQCVITLESNNIEYDAQNFTPTYLGGQTTFGHGICGLVYGLLKGIKVTICADSSGQWSSPKGIRIITEDFLTHRATGALYFLGSVEKPSQTPQNVTETIKTPNASIHTTAPQNFFDRVMAFLRALGIPYTVQNGGIIGDVSLNNNQNYMESSNVGSYVAVASLLVAALGYFGVIIPQNQAVEVITGLVALYGIVHQYADKKKVVAAAQAAGANIR